MNRRDFAKLLLSSPAWLSALPASAAASGLDNEIDAVLKRHFVIDTAASDAFFSAPGGKSHPFHPASTLEVIGGASLGIGGLSGQFPIPLPKRSRNLWKRYGMEYTYAGAEDGPATVEHMPGEFDGIRQAVERNPDRAGVARSAEEMKALHHTGKLALVIGLDTSYEIDGNLAVLREYHRLGLRKLAVTHEVAPPWAESDTGDTGAGLKPFGREVVAECNRLGIMVDISHSSDATFWDVLKCSRRPIIATHSGARGRQDIPRNMTDEMILALVKGGGMIGVGGSLDEDVIRRGVSAGFAQARFRVAQWLANKYPDRHEFALALENPAKQAEARKALGLPAVLPGLEEPPMSPESTLAHLDYLIPKIGFDHIGFGTDLEMSHPNYPGMIRGIVGGLLRRRYSEEQMGRILGGNFLRYFRDAAA